MFCRFGALARFQNHLGSSVCCCAGATGPGASGLPPVRSGRVLCTVYSPQSGWAAGSVDLAAVLNENPSLHGFRVSNCRDIHLNCVDMKSFVTLITGLCFPFLTPASGRIPQNYREQCGRASVRGEQSLRFPSHPLDPLKT